MVVSHAKTSRIPPFGLGEKNKAKNLSFSPSIETNKKRKKTELTRRGITNVLA